MRLMIWDLQMLTKLAKKERQQLQENNVRQKGHGIRRVVVTNLFRAHVSATVKKVSPLFGDETVSNTHY